jgi:hypothetical protein
VKVTRKDGFTVSGQLLASDADTLTIEPTGMAGQKARPIKLSWSSVEAVSNGLTREKAAEQWKREHKDELCQDCKGNRQVTCGTCKGVGHDPAASKGCKTCKGALTVACKEPRCKEGKIPCPGPCLKLTEGVWEKRPEGGSLLWHEVTFTVNGKRRIGYFSQTHVGEIVKFDASGNRPTRLARPAVKRAC